MEPIATYDEILAMDDSTFVKTFKEKQLVEAKKVVDAKAAATVIATRDAELKAFDEETQKQMSALQVSRSMARTLVEQKYITVVKEPIIVEKVI